MVLFKIILVSTVFFVIYHTLREELVQQIGEGRPFSSVLTIVHCSAEWIVLLLVI